MQHYVNATFEQNNLYTECSIFFSVKTISGVAGLLRSVVYNDEFHGQF